MDRDVIQSFHPRLKRPPVVIDFVQYKNVTIFWETANRLYTYEMTLKVNYGHWRSQLVLY